MKKPSNWFQKLGVCVCVTALSGMLLAQPSAAAPSSALMGSSSGTTNYLLTLILGTTAGILKLLNQSPAYAEALTEMAKSWIETDDEYNTIGNSQYLFANLADIRVNAEKTQITTTTSLTEQFLKMGSFKSDKQVLPGNANDLTYTILFGQPIVKPNDASLQPPDYTANIQNYIKNVTGSTLLLEQPNPNWPDSKSRTQYINLYNTLASIQSYNQYLITGLATLKKRQELSAKLIAQASDSGWFKQVSTEALGLVIRHILMFTSQSFVQISQVIELQQKQLAAQAMTNSLLVILVQANVGTSLQQAASRSGSSGTSDPASQV